MISEIKTDLIIDHVPKMMQLINKRILEGISIYKIIEK
jgi:hypothetical protein